MFRPLAFVAVRKQHHQTAHAQPFLLARGNELVDDDLRAIGEVAELGFPQGQGLRFGQGIAVFESEHAEFGQRRVQDLERRLAETDVGQRGVAVLVFLVDQHGMALRKRAAFAVLARQADRMALDDQGAEGQGLGGRPVDTFSGVDHLGLGGQLAFDLGVRGEVARKPGQAGADFLQKINGTAGLAAPGVAGGNRHAGPYAVHPIRLVGLVALGCLESLIHGGDEGLHLLFDFVLGQDFFVDQLAGVDVQRRRMRLNGLVHLRLGEHRLVAFVMAVAAITDHVHHHVLLEALTVFRGDARRMDNGFDVVGVDVENGRGNDLGRVGTIG